MERMKVADLKALGKERGLRGYSKLRKAKLITFLQNNFQPTPAPRTRPPRPPGPPPPPPAWKQIKRMKKKLGKLNKKIRHSKRKHNNLISKRNSRKKKIEKLKGPREPEPEESFNPTELEQAFNKVYRSYRINGRSRMDIDTFLDRIRPDLIDLMNRELTDLGSARVQTTVWIRFIQALQDDFGNIIGSDRVEKPFSSKMTKIHQGSDLNEIIDEMLAHMKTQIENPALIVGSCSMKFYF